MTKRAPEIHAARHLVPHHLSMTLIAVSRPPVTSKSFFIWQFVLHLMIVISLYSIFISMWDYLQSNGDIVS